MDGVRQKPEDGDNYGWNSFEIVADFEGFGNHKDDWEPSWNLWKTDYIAGYTDGIHKAM